MVTSLISIPKLSHVSFLFHYAQRICQSNLVWYEKNCHQLLRDFTHSGVSTVDFELANTGWVTSSFTMNQLALLYVSIQYQLCI